MHNRIYEYYRDELRYLYEEGAEFSANFQDVAGLLDFKKNADEDPFVRRLVEAFAFLTARIQMKIDSDFPQIAEALLEQVMPLCTKPFPAMAVVQFDPGEQLKPGGEFLKKDETNLKLDNYSETYFRTCYDLRCAALKVKSCKLSRDFKENQEEIGKKSAAVLASDIQGSDGLSLNVALGENADSLTLYLADPDIQYETAELLLNPGNLLGFGYQLPDGTHFQFDTRDLRVLGFERDEQVMPVSDCLPHEYQILLELFAYPLKHLFFQIPIPPEVSLSTDSKFQLFFYLRTSNERLESLISDSSLRLNCCPAVNLHKAQTVSTKISRYCVNTVVDANLTNTDFEIFDLGKVVATDDEGRKKDLTPIYGVESAGRENEVFFSTTRRPLKSKDGSDVLLSIVDLAFNPESSNQFMELFTNPECCNRRFRDLSLISQDSKDFKVLSSGLVDSATRISDWQRMLVTDSDSHDYWQLVSLINLNFLFLKKSAQPETLRRILELLDRTGNEFTKAWINSIVDVDCTRKTDRIESRPWSAFADGTVIEIKLNETRSSQKPGSWFLFALGLDRFFSLHTGINSFTQVVIRASEDDRTLASFEKRCGTRQLI